MQKLASFGAMQFRFPHYEMIVGPTLPEVRAIIAEQRIRGAPGWLVPLSNLLKWLGGISQRDAGYSQEAASAANEA